MKLQKVTPYLEDSDGLLMKVREADSKTRSFNKLLRENDSLKHHVAFLETKQKRRPKSTGHSSSRISRNELDDLKQLIQEEKKLNKAEWRQSTSRSAQHNLVYSQRIYSQLAQQQDQQQTFEYVAWRNPLLI